MNGPASILFDVNGNPLTTMSDGSLLVTLADGYVTMSGPVTVANFPVTQSISGTVSVSNLPATQPVSGSVSVSNLPVTQPVSGSVSVSNLPAIQSVVTNKASTAATTSVVSAFANTVLLAANAARLSAHVFNSANKTMYVKLGTAASLTSYADQVLQGSSWDAPDGYTGAISAIWASGVNGTAVLVTELSP